MAEKYSRSLLRIAVAQICQNLGWNAIQSTPIELLTDILERYLSNVGRTVHDYSEQFCRTDPNLNDIGLAFHDLGINLEELADYVEHVEPACGTTDLPKFPASRPSHLGFPAQHSRELREREEHVYEHLPKMYPAMEEDSPERFNSSNGNNRESVMQVSPLVPVAGEKRSMSSPVDLTPPPAKRSRILPEEAAPSQYEMKGVTMTNAGLLTPTKGQGKLPDSRTPPPPTPGTPNVVLNLGPLIAAPESPPNVEMPPAVFTETVPENIVMDDDPDYRPTDKDSLNSSTSGVKTPKPREVGKRGRGRGRGKGRGRSPKQGRSPGRGRSPKGKTPEVKQKELIPETVAPSPALVPPPVDPMEESPESPKLMIDEEKGLQKEAAEAREKRLAAYDHTIDDVIKRAMSQPEEEEEEEDEVKEEAPLSPPRPVSYPPQEETLTSLIHPPPPPVNENEEERQRRRDIEVQQELEHIQEKKKEWERQERQRIEKIEREIRIDDTINDVIRNAGVSSDDDHQPPFVDSLEAPPPPVIPLVVPPVKEPNVFDFEEEDFSPPAIPDIPMSPQQDEQPAEDIVIKEKSVKAKKSRGRGAGKSPGSTQKVKEKLKKKLQKQQDEDVPDWPISDEPLDLTGSAPPPVEKPVSEPFSISIPELAAAAEAMKAEPSPPIVPSLKIKALKEEKEHSSKKEKKKKKNKDKDKDKDKSKEKKRDKKDKEKKKEKHDKEKKEKEGDSILSVPKLTLRLGGKNKEVSVEPDPPKPEITVPKLVLKRPIEEPPPPRVPTKAAMKQAPIANIPPPAPVLRPPTPSPPSSPSLPPSPPMETRVATPPPPSKFTSPPPPAAKARDITPPPPPSSSLRSKSNPTPVLTVETVGADAPARAVFTETVGSFFDENGEKVWICPACKMQDDGSPMVGCDDCDDWYHYPCVGITQDPPENEPWYCPRCNARRIKEASSSGRGGRGRKKRKKKA